MTGSHVYRRAVEARRRSIAAKDDARRFLAAKGAEQNDPPEGAPELWETLMAIAQMARDGEIGVIAVTIVPAQDGGESVGVQFDFDVERMGKP